MSSDECTDGKSNSPDGGGRDIGRAVALKSVFLMRREDTAEEVAEAVVYLASDAAGFVTGDSLEINGGLYFV